MANVIHVINQAELNRLTAAQVSLKWNGVAVKLNDYIADNGATMLLTANPGRILSGINQWSDQAGTYPFVISPDGKTGTLITKVGMRLGSANSQYTTIPEPSGTVLYTLTQTELDKITAAGASAFKNDVAATVGTEFKQNDVFKLTTPNTKTFVDGGVKFNFPVGIRSFTLTTDKSAASFTFGLDEIVSDLSVATIIKPVVVWKLTNADITRLNDNYAYLYKNNVRAILGTEFFLNDVVKVTPDRALRQLQNAWLNSTDSAGAYQRLILVQNADKSEGVYTIVNERPITGLIVTTEARPTKYIFKQSDVEEFANAQATLRVNGVLAVVGTNIAAGDVLLAVAKSGRVFTADTPSYQTSSGGLVVFIHNEDDTQASVTVVEEMSNAGNYSNFNVSTVLAPSPDVRGLNNVYKVTQNQLKSITQERFEVNQQGQVVDYGNYIIGLIELPFKTDLAYDVGSQDVQLGPKKTDISAILLDRDNIRLNLGVIHVTSVKNNFLDYKNTTALIHLPYCEPINIDMEYVIDQDVTIDYIINIYDGTATINITSSKTDEIVITQNIDMGIVVPFANVDSFPTKNDPRSIKLGADNGVKTAFIEILRNESILENGFFTIPVVDETTLSTYNGFAQVEQINLKSKATSFEKDLIISQLRDGVIIK